MKFHYYLDCIKGIDIKFKLHSNTKTKMYTKNLFFFFYCGMITLIRSIYTQELFPLFQTFWRKTRAQKMYTTFLFHGAGTVSRYQSLYHQMFLALLKTLKWRKEAQLYNQSIIQSSGEIQSYPFCLYFTITNFWNISTQNHGREKL